MRARQRLVLIALAVVVLVVAFVVARARAATTARTPRRRWPPRRAPPATATVHRDDLAATRRDRAGARRPDASSCAAASRRAACKKLQFAKGDQVAFRVRSDIADEVHVHGYDLTKDVQGGGTVHFSFRATIDGIFVVELEGRGEQIAELEVAAVSGAARPGGAGGRGRGRRARVAAPDRRSAHGLVGEQDLPIPRWLFALGARRSCWSSRSSALAVAVAASRGSRTPPRARGCFGVPRVPRGRSAARSASRPSPSSSTPASPARRRRPRTSRRRSIYVVFWVGLPVASRAVRRRLPAVQPVAGGRRARSAWRRGRGRGRRCPSRCPTPSASAAGRRRSGSSPSPGSSSSTPTATTRATLAMLALAYAAVAARRA